MINFDLIEVIVDVHCGAAILRGADVFIPGIVAATSDGKIMPLPLSKLLKFIFLVEKNCRVSVFVDIDGKCLRGRTTSYDGQRIFVGCGVSQVSRNQVFCNKTENNESSTHNGVGILMTEPIYRTASIGREIGDKFFLQNLPSILVGHALSPTSSDTVLDMCAAPGGKTSHLACLMGNTGRLFALDKSKSKVEKISTLLRALNLADAVQVKCFDSTKCLKNNLFEKESFDCILLDPPCSGVGQRPQFRWDNQMSLENLQSHASYQRKLLSVAIDLLKPGGVLVYSTCTINPEENEENISWVLQNYRSQMQLCDISDMIQKSYGMPNHHVDCSLDSIDLKKILRFDPIDTHGIGRDTIGFFMAKFRKIVP